jgi:Carboxypeptidase regulatory-like domain
MYVRSLLVVGASAWLVAALACGSKDTTTPSSPTAPAPTGLSLGGTVLGHQQASSSIPIPGATVSIISGPDTGKSTLTDDSGNFSLKGLHQDHIVVSVSAVGYLSGSALVSQAQPPTVFLVPTGASIVLTGTVTDASTSAPISGATVSINSRYATTSDESGNYSVSGYLDQGPSSVVYVYFASGYENYARYIRGTLSQSFQLQRIERITAGDSWSVTVGPDDSLCYNNSQDPQEGTPGGGYRCRRVRVLAPVSGVMMLEAVSTSGGVRPAPLEVERLVGPCCAEPMGNPTSIEVTAGTEVGVFVELPESATASQSFILNTSMAGP